MTQSDRVHGRPLWSQTMSVNCRRSVHRENELHCVAPVRLENVQIFIMQSNRHPTMTLWGFERQDSTTDLDVFILLPRLDHVTIWIFIDSSTNATREYDNHQLAILRPACLGQPPILWPTDFSPSSRWQIPTRARQTSRSKSKLSTEICRIMSCFLF